MTREFLKKKGYVCMVAWGFLMVLTVYGSLGCEKKSIASLEDVNLPEQVTCSLSEKDISAILDHAISKKDALLLDRIAWCSKRKDIIQKAEDALVEITKDYSDRFVSKIARHDSTTVSAGGIALGKAFIMHSNPPFRIRPGRKFDKGIKVWLDRPQRHMRDDLKFGWTVEYAVIVDGSVKPGYRDLSFEVVGKHKYTYDNAVDEAPIHVGLKVIGGVPFKPKAVDVYTVTSLYQRQLLRELEKKRRALGLYRSAIDKDDKVLIELIGSSMKYQEDKIEESLKKAHDFLMLLNILGESKDQKLATAARQCLKITKEKWPDWEKLIKVNSNDGKEDDEGE